MSYSKNKKRLFDYTKVKDDLNIDSFGDDLISDAFRVLIGDGLIQSHWADDVPYTSELLINAVNQAESDTRLAKIYRILKEVRSWL